MHVCNEVYGGISCGSAGLETAIHTGLCDNEVFGER